MAYYRLPEKELRAYCEAVMGKYGFNEKQSRDIADILLTADLQGLESHGVQRLIRYHRGVKSGVIRPDAVPEVVHETPLSVVLDAHSAMGQIAAVDAMERAIAKAKQYGFGAAVVRNSNHFGVGGYYAMMAEREDMLGMCFTNTQAICRADVRPRGHARHKPHRLCHARRSHSHAVRRGDHGRAARQAGGLCQAGQAHAARLGRR